MQNASHFYKMSFPRSYNHLLTTGTNDPTLIITRAQQMKGHQYWWLAGGYVLKIGHFRRGLHGGYMLDSGYFAQWVLVQ